MRDEQENLGGASTSPAADVAGAERVATVDLRILATTDIHMQLLGFDYARDRNGHHAGLAGLASLIKNARAECRAQNKTCLLLDNGDLLQGAALDQTLAETPVTPEHPIVACLNHLEYDGYGVGNHDLDHGIDYLNAIAAELVAPMIGSNLQLHGPTAIKRYAVITLPVAQDSTGKAHALRIGLVSALPEKTAKWNARELLGNAAIEPILTSVEQSVHEVRQQGADIVVLLAHLGVEPTQDNMPYTDDARLLADVAGVDTIIMGHTHRRLPGQDHAGFARIDVLRGTVGQRPSVMAGFDASDLAVLDLQLSRHADASWHVSKHTTGLRPNTLSVPADPAIVEICRPAHEQTRTHLGTRCGHIDRPLHNFFSLARPTSTCALVANAKWHAIRDGIAHLPEARLPLLATASAHTAGGRGGPTHFLSIPKGPVLGRHMAALSPYANGTWALLVTGADLHHWLENSASVYTRLTPERPEQPLLLEARPSFDFDTIYGLTYHIDPTKPAGARIGALTYQGLEVLPDQQFVLATNNFRATGGGGGQSFDDERVILRSAKPAVQTLRDVLVAKQRAFDLDARPWRFAPSLGVNAVLQTTPEALAHLDDIKELDPKPDTLDARGFARIQLTL